MRQSGSYKTNRIWWQEYGSCLREHMKVLPPDVLADEATDPTTYMARTNIIGCNLMW